MHISDHIQSILNGLPSSPGVYQHLDKDGQIIYVGKAKNLKRRVSSYFQKEHQTSKTLHLVDNIADIKYIVVASEQDAFLLENNLIKKYQPKYNILLKDGKSYPSICITREEYPRVFKTRKIIPSLGDYYGPFSFGNTVDLVLELIHQLYPIRTCTLSLTDKGIETGKYKTCLKYHIHKCCGICEGYISKEQYQEYISQIRKIIQGDAHEISKQLLEQMKQYAEKLKFEQAQKLKEKYELIERFKSKTIITNTNIQDTDVFGYIQEDNSIIVSMLKIHCGSIVQGNTIEYKTVTDIEEKEETLGRAIQELRNLTGSLSKNIIVPFLPDYKEENINYTIPQRGDQKKILDLAMQNAKQYIVDRRKQQDKLNPEQRQIRILTKLQDLLDLPTLPTRIECFDNSNIQGTNAVAGCVVFEMGKPLKSDYKKFNIKYSDGNDDYGQMQEVVLRKYSHTLENEEPLPNLIIADGGIGQMHAILSALQNLQLDIPIAGLCKDNHHHTSALLYGFPPAEIDIRPTDELFLFLTRIQDEVHRFAISYHKKKRSKSQTASELDEIKGIGSKTKTTLLTHFKSIKRLREAGLASITEIVGNNRASIVYNHFHPDLSR